VTYASRSGATADVTEAIGKMLLDNCVEVERHSRTGAQSQSAIAQLN
jgi:hypothetical protein